MTETDGNEERNYVSHSPSSFSGNQPQILSIFQSIGDQQGAMREFVNRTITQRSQIIERDQSLYQLTTSYYFTHVGTRRVFVAFTIKLLCITELWSLDVCKDPTNQPADTYTCMSGIYFEAPRLSKGMQRTNNDPPYF